MKPNKINDEFTLQEEYSNKLIKKLNDLFVNYSKASGKERKDGIQIEIDSNIGDLEEEITSMKKVLASRTDYSNIEFSRREGIVENFKKLLADYKQKSLNLQSERLDYDPRESILKKTEDEKRKMLKDKSERLNKIYHNQYNEVRQMKRGATAISEELEKDKIRTNILSNNILDVATKVEQTETNLEEYLKKSSLVNSCSNYCLWMTALIEFLVILLVLAI